MLLDAMPMRRLPLAAIVTTLAFVLAGCESARLGTGASPRGRVAELPEPDPITPAVPSGSVTAEPLAPPGGIATLGGGGGEVPSFGGSPQPVPTLGGGGGGGSPAPAPNSRTAAVGAWTAKDASGSCRITLSSSPSLDLYRATAGACPNKDLGRVTAWDFRDGEVYLFQPGGAVAARLRPSDGGFSGVLSKSGAPLSLTRG